MKFISSERLFIRGLLSPPSLRCFFLIPITDKFYGSFGSDHIHFAKWFRDLLNSKHFPSVIVSLKEEIKDRGQEGLNTKMPHLHSGRVLFHVMLSPGFNFRQKHLFPIFQNRKGKMPFLVSFSCGTARCQTRPTSEPSWQRRQRRRGVMEVPSAIGSTDVYTHWCASLWPRHERGNPSESATLWWRCKWSKIHIHLSYTALASMVIPDGGDGGGVILMHIFGCGRKPASPQRTGSQGEHAASTLKGLWPRGIQN